MTRALDAGTPGLGSAPTGDEREVVADSAGLLVREVETMPDGRGITYYRKRSGQVPTAARPVPEAGPA